MAEIPHEMPQLIKFIARLVDAATGAPVANAAYRVRFFDRDLFKDDPLGEAVLSKDGAAEIICSTASWQTGVLGKVFQRLRERTPDVYIEVVEGSEVLFRSQVKTVEDPLTPDEVTKRVNLTIDLGEYRFRKGDGLA